LSAAEQELSRLRKGAAEVQRLQLEVSSLKTALGAAMKECESLRNEAETGRAEKKELAKSLSSSQQEIQELRDLMRGMSPLKRQVKDSELSAMDAQTQIQALQLRIEELKQLLLASQDSHHSDAGELKKKIVRLEQLLDDKNSVHSVSMQDMEDKCARLTRELAHKQDELAASHQESDSLRAQLRQLHQVEEELRLKLDRNSGEMQKMQEYADRLKSSVSEVEAQYADRVTSLQASKESLEGRVSSINKQHQDLISQHNRAQEKLRTFAKRYEEMERELRSKIEFQNEKINAMKAQMEKMKVLVVVVDKKEYAQGKGSIEESVSKALGNLQGSQFQGDAVKDAIKKKLAEKGIHSKDDGTALPADEIEERPSRNDPSAVASRPTRSLRRISSGSSRRV
jgi:chromosome segregation ATPase